MISHFKRHSFQCAVLQNPSADFCTHDEVNRSCAPLDSIMQKCRIGQLARAAAGLVKIALLTELKTKLAKRFKSRSGPCICPRCSETCSRNSRQRKCRHRTRSSLPCNEACVVSCALASEAPCRALTFAEMPLFLLKDIPLVLQQKY